MILSGKRVSINKRNSEEIEMVIRKSDGRIQGAPY
jgi:hypothetical protein